MSSDLKNEVQKASYQKLVHAYSSNMTESSYLRTDSQVMQRDNYGLVENQRLENNQKCCCWKLLKWARNCVLFVERCCSHGFLWCLSLIYYISFYKRLGSCNRRFVRCCYNACKRNVQIYVSKEAESPEGFVSAISSLCKEISYQCLKVNDIGMLFEGVPLVVVCPITSRLEPDIDCLLNGIKWKTTFVVLLIHYGTKSSPPILPTSFHLTRNNKYQHAEFIDIAFNADSQLYQCHTNETAKSQLQLFLNRFYNK